MKVAMAVAAVAAAMLAGTAQAQSYQCSIPKTLPRPRPDRVTEQRLLPIGGYTLALTWAPQFCHEKSRDPSASFECGGRNRFGFTLHGLWPDGVGKEWPQYCTATALLPPAVIKRHVCSTPSVQLMQHEWAKHGTCMGTTPAAYFGKSTGLYGALRYPDMDALSRAPLNAGKLADAIAAANPGLPANAIRVTANRQGWLDELWLCLDKRFAYARCTPGSGGLAPTATVKIWRGKR